MEKVKEALNEEKSKGAFSITIITGNSSVLQKRIFKAYYFIRKTFKIKDEKYTYLIHLKVRN